MTSCRAPWWVAVDLLPDLASLWAVLFGVILLDVGMVDDPGFVRMGERTLRAVDEGP